MNSNWTRKAHSIQYSNQTIQWSKGLQRLHFVLVLTGFSVLVFTQNHLINLNSCVFTINSTARPSHMIPKKKTMLHSEIAARLNSVSLDNALALAGWQQDFLTYCTACVDSPTAAFQKYNSTPTNQHLSSVTASCHFYFVNLFINWTPEWPVLFCFCLNILACRSTPMRQHWNNFFKACQAPFDIFFFFVLPPPLLFLFVNNNCSLGSEMLKILLVSEEIKRLAISNMCSQSHILTRTVCSWFTVCVIFSSACASHLLSCVHSIEPEAVCVSLSEWDWKVTEN